MKIGINIAGLSHNDLGNGMHSYKDGYENEESLRRRGSQLSIAIIFAHFFAAKASTPRIYDIHF